MTSWPPCTAPTLGAVILVEPPPEVAIFSYLAPVAPRSRALIEWPGRPGHWINARDLGASGSKYETIATSVAGSNKITVAKVNVDNNQELAGHYNVSSIPALMIFKDGKVHATQVGAVGKAALTQLIERAI